MDLPETLLYEVKEHIAIITLNRPERYNSITPEMRTGLREAFNTANADDDIWVIIFQAAGEKAFCAGADLGSTVKNLTTTPDSQLREVVPDPTKRHFSDIYKPIIAAVNGICTAGGLEMLQGTDIRIASENARFGLGEVRWGIVPLGGSHVRLPRQIPWAVAMEILLTGDMIEAERAREIGLVNRIVPLAELHDAAFALASRLCENGPMALRTAKESVVRSMQLDAAFANDFYLASRVFYSEDAKEGPKAFKEKRKPDYQNR
jgi:enoyl-CoA hydratase